MTNTGRLKPVLVGIDFGVSVRVFCFGVILTWTVHFTHSEDIPNFASFEV
jgi:hypothetical protein